MVSHLDIRLLGRPVVLLDDVEAPPPRGAKPWALLAYLAGSPRAHPRVELAELLFAEAADPLGALRWNLAAIRRLLGRPEALKGDTIGLDLPDATVDVRRLDRGEVAGIHTGALDTLLAGMSFPDSPTFEMWLTGERSRLRRRGISLVRESALRSLVSGELDAAVARATELVSADPFDESHHALLIRARAAAGDVDAALAQYEQCRALLRTELSVEPGAAVLAAAHFAVRGSGASRPTGLATLEAHLSVAWQSFLAGSVDHGIDLGRDAAAMADREHDTGFRIMARLFFAAMLSIAVRRSDEGAAIVTEALLLAEQADLGYEQAAARGVMAGIDLMRADYSAAAGHASAGAELSDDPGNRALTSAFLSAVTSDVGPADRAIELATDAVDFAEQSMDPIRVVYAHAYAGHALLLDDRAEAARPHVVRAVDAASSILVLQPWPLSMLSEIDLRAGRADDAVRSAERAEAIASTTGIAYQQALALRALALVDAERGELDQALDRLTDALGRARRTTGEGYPFHWPIAWILESLARISARRDPEASRRWAEALLEHATAVGMHTFIRRGEQLITESPRTTRRPPFS